MSKKKKTIESYKFVILDFSKDKNKPYPIIREGKLTRYPDENGKYLIGCDPYKK